MKRNVLSAFAFALVAAGLFGRRIFRLSVEYAFIRSNVVFFKNKGRPFNGKRDISLLLSM